MESEWLGVLARTRVKYSMSHHTQFVLCKHPMANEAIIFLINPIFMKSIYNWMPSSSFALTYAPHQLETQLKMFESSMQPHILATCCKMLQFNRHLVLDSKILDSTRTPTIRDQETEGVTEVPEVGGDYLLYYVRRR
jgi:hypothetical protein